MITSVTASGCSGIVTGDSSAIVTPPVRYLPGFPAPLEFYSRLIKDFEVQLQAYDGGVEPGFFPAPVLERGWIWLGLPSKKATEKCHNYPNSILEFISSYHLLLRCTGCKWSTVRTEFNHVGTSWAPAEFLPDLWVRENHVPEGTRIACLTDPTFWGRMPERLTQIIPLFGGKAASTLKGLKEQGFLLNPTPRKKRVMKKDTSLDAALTGLLSDTDFLTTSVVGV